MLNAVIVIMLTFYCAMVLYAAFRWRNLSNRPKSKKKPTVFNRFTILVAVRNEELNLPSLLDSILQLDYPRDCFELIVINDHSEDATLSVLKSYPEVRILELSASQGKKAALEMGVENAHFEWVVVTDGDCIVPPGWLTEFNRHVCEETHLMFGPLELRGRGFGHDFQAMEQAALMALGAIAIADEKPIMMNAANMVFRKSSFNEVGGYSDNRCTASGDDQFLMSAINAQFPRGIKFIKSQKLIVNALSASTLRQFINQRMRWASKWKKQSSPIIALGVWIFYVAYSSAIIYLLIGQQWAFISLIALKFAADYFLTRSVFRFLNRKVFFTSFVVGQILYPVYAILIGILANLGAYSWKGRTININE